MRSLSLSTSVRVSLSFLCRTRRFASAAATLKSSTTGTVTARLPANSTSKPQVTTSSKVVPVMGPYNRIMESPSLQPELLTAIKTRLDDPQGILNNLWVKITTSKTSKPNIIEHHIAMAIAVSPTKFLSCSSRENPRALHFFFYHPIHGTRYSTKVWLVKQSQEVLTLLAQVLEYFALKRATSFQFLHSSEPLPSFSLPAQPKVA